MNTKHVETLKALLECLQECNHCFDACLNEDDVKMMADCIRLDRECADICAFTAQALMRNSPVSDELLKACAAICERCADECAKHEAEHCKKCAEACRKCAEACRKAVA